MTWARTRPDAARESVWRERLQAEDLITELSDGAACLGVAVSLEPTTGDPNLLAVLPDGAYEPCWVDRRHMRLLPRAGVAPPAHEERALKAADLVDRVQLSLGEPVAVGYVEVENKLRAAWVRPVRPQVQFANTACRRIAPFVGDQSTLSPLSVDALDRALRVEDERGDGPTVRRTFARAYRQIGPAHTPWVRGQRLTRTAATGRVSLMAKAVSSVLREAARYGGQGGGLRSGPTARDLTQADTQDLLDLLRARMADVTDALVLLERARFVTLGVLPLLDALCGNVPREAFATLAAPRPTRDRAQLDAKLLAFADEHGLIASGSCGPVAAPLAEGAEWSRLRAEVMDVRVLGMDVRYPAMGASDPELRRAITEAHQRQAQSSERTRHDAERRLVRLAFRDIAGALRVGTLSLALGLLRRLARAKGVFAEVLAASLLEFRVVVLEAGRRLLEAGIVEEPEDLFFLELSEIEQALDGEIGAYASRVRFRREEDRRWRSFDAPRLISPRRPATQ